MYKLCFYVPDSHLERVKEALFKSGAGRIGNYDCCAWQVKGQGQFRALEGSNPFIGRINEVETVSEYKVEMVFEDRLREQIIRALKESHPYEEPAYDIWRLEN
ncbi:MAG TPA: YqfO family protein [Spirochaetota bacterium]|nr:YqfO family protein [Spirochaetota bacterium]HSA15171.1 YqfO family protein [Spirochaetota bacterium]